MSSLQRIIADSSGDLAGRRLVTPAGTLRQPVQTSMRLVEIVHDGVDSATFGFQRGDGDRHAEVGEGRVRKHLPWTGYSLSSHYTRLLMRRCLPHSEGSFHGKCLRTLQQEASFGMSVSHSHRRTRRRWNPNIQRVRAVVNGSTKRIDVRPPPRQGRQGQPPPATGSQSPPGASPLHQAMRTVFRPLVKTSRL